MTTLFIIIFLSFALVIFIMKFIMKKEVLPKLTDETDKLEYVLEKSLYKKKEFLLSPAERSFLGVLEQSVGNDFKIFCKVRIADVIGIDDTKNKKAWWSAFGKISKKHFDYVICANTDCSIKGVIELNDKSHQELKRKNRDTFVSEICESSKLPLIMIPAKNNYVVGDIQSIIGAALNVYSPPLTLDTLSPDGIKLLHQEVIQDIICPKCNSPMILRKKKNEGKEFWGCSQFPKCRKILTQGEIL